MGYCFFFFFQAEDGIRDGTVTGVQTCALPISVAGEVGAAPPPGRVLVSPPPETAALTYDGSTAWSCPPAPRGVGSNRSQPTPLKYSSGQACASAVVTAQVPPGRGWPAV